MRIQSNDVIAGQPVLTIRDFLRNHRTSITVDAIATCLDVDIATAKQILQNLVTEGYIEPAEESQEIWYTTTQGNALANAKAEKPITRRTADRLIKEFLERVQTINACNDYAYRIAQVIIFGSYLSDSPTLGDVDLSIKLSHRYDDAQKQTHMREERIRHALQEGRNFSTFLHQVAWPELEIWHILKGRSRGLSLHDETTEQVLSQPIPSRILFPESLSMRRNLPDLTS
ncbi:MAG: hypothetical protein E6J34_03460 [Chloroflexi bacterium]|nr:MAG: hypothetical protein E6J34_03460 [Chloroflexota bacterium]